MTAAADKPMNPEVGSNLFAALDADLSRVLGGLEDEAGNPVPEPEAKAKEPEPKAEEAKETKGEKEEDVAKTSTPVARALARIAAREAEVAKREAALKAAPKDEPKKDEAPKAPTPGNLTIGFRKDPLGTMKALGFGDDEVGEIFRAGMADILGDKAPDGYREIRARGGLDARFREIEAQNTALREEINRRDQEAQARMAQDAQARYVNEYQNEARTYLKSQDCETPLVAALYASDADDVLEDIMKVVMADAQAKIARGDVGAMPLTPKEAAAKIEARLEKIRGKLSPQAPARTPSLRNASTTPNSQAPAVESVEDFDVTKAADRALAKLGIK